VKIAALQLVCRDLDGQRRFYGEILELPLLEDSETGFTVQVGFTTLSFELRPELLGLYHLAFNIPPNQFAAAKAWISARTALLRDGDGDEFEASPDWNAHQFYFCDADGNILECIARRRLPPASAPFGPASLRNVSEIGYPVADVPRTCQRLERELGIRPFGTPSDTFASMGDDQGLLIVVKRGRGWFPTGEAASVLPLKIKLEGVNTPLSEESDSAFFRLSSP
jgi:catechol-2,3-dioxygenase